MTEEIVWRGAPSQWKNFGVYLLCGLFCWLIVPIFFGVPHYLQTKCKIFELTTFTSKNGCMRSTSNSDALGAFFRYERAVVIAADVIGSVGVWGFLEVKVWPTR